MVLNEQAVEEAMYRILEAAQKSNWQIEHMPPSLSLAQGLIQTRTGPIIQNMDEYPVIMEAWDRLLNEKRWIRHSNGVVHKVDPQGRSALEQYHQRGKAAPEDPRITVHQETTMTSKSREFSNKVFIVHGLNTTAKFEASTVIFQAGLEPIILHEQPNAGHTIIEKLEHNADVGFAVVLLTADDTGYRKDHPDESKARARQNVIMELGFFIGKLGRGKVCALYEKGVEIPSDYQGVLYIEMDSHGAWKYKLAKEMQHAGLTVQLEKISH